MSSRSRKGRKRGEGCRARQREVKVKRTAKTAGRRLEDGRLNVRLDGLVIVVVVIICSFIEALLSLPFYF